MSAQTEDQNNLHTLKLVSRAAAFAAQAHVKQKRKAEDQPYINHLLRVMHQAALANLPPEAVAAAALHDVLEDTPVTQPELAAEFPARVVDLVERLTQTWADDASEEIKKREKPPYYSRILQDGDAISLKLLDRADNLSDMTRMLPRIERWASKYLKRTEEELTPLYEASQNDYARRTYQIAIQRMRENLP